MYRGDVEVKISGREIQDSGAPKLSVVDARGLMQGIFAGGRLAVDKADLDESRARKVNDARATPLYASVTASAGKYRENGEPEKAETEERKAEDFVAEIEEKAILRQDWLVANDGIIPARWGDEEDGDFNIVDDLEKAHEAKVRLETRLVDAVIAHPSYSIAFAGFTNQPLTPEQLKAAFQRASREGDSGWAYGIKEAQVRMGMAEDQIARIHESLFGPPKPAASEW